MDEFEILTRIQVLRAELRETERMTIQSLRMQGHSIPRIAEAMGVSRQLLRKRMATGFYGEVLSTERTETYR